MVNPKGRQYFINISVYIYIIAESVDMCICTFCLHYFVEKKIFQNINIILSISHYMDTAYL